MKYTYNYLLPFSLLMLLFSCSKKLSIYDNTSNISDNPQLSGLQVNYEAEPLGIDSKKILFSWRMESPETDKMVAQKAYRIIVKDEEEKEVWNTGIDSSTVSVAIAYEGEPLRPTTRYTWNVSVWSQDNVEINNSSWFETGLMNPGISAWDGAKWIGGTEDDLVLQSHYLSVFKLEYKLQLDKSTSSPRASFLFGANDTRLMDKNLNLKKMEASRDESYIAIELDISEVSSGDNALLHIYRVGYTTDDSYEKPLISLPISRDLINLTNMYDPHSFFILAVFGSIDIFIDGEGEGNKINQNQPGSFRSSRINLNPYGSGGDFICFPLLADIGFRVEASKKAIFSEVKVKHFRDPSNIVFEEDLGEHGQSIFSKIEGVTIMNHGYIVGDNKSEILAIADPSRNAMPILRSEFFLDNIKIKKARLYVTARGIYEMYINGEKVSNDYFNPGLTQYNKHHMYQTYDVTDMIRPGESNAWGARLGEGWWSGNITFTGDNWNYFGDRQSLLAKMVITYEDGIESVMVTKPGNWKYYNDGPIKYGSFFQGEVYDATKEEAIEGWATPNYNPKNWHYAEEINLDGTAMVGAFSDFIGRPKSLDYNDQKIIGQIGSNVSHVMTLQAQSVHEIRPGVFVYDMGQNMVGFPSIALENGTSGDTIRLRYAEIKYPDLGEYKEHTGMIMIENIRAALTQDIYIMKDGAQTFQPSFTFHGYRFLEITGLSSPLPLESVKGMVLSSVKDLSSGFECSNKLVNKFWENVTWSLRGNFLSIPTDTPARNERMGWNGDLNVFARTATWLTPANQFLKRHMLAMRDMQAEDGRFSDVAPIGNGFGGTLWGSAGIIVAWEAYQQYGDVYLLEEHYTAMKDYVLFLASKENDKGILMEGPLGDWLSPENGKNDQTLLWNAYQIYDLKILEKIATILSKKEDALLFKTMLDQRKVFFNETYVNPENHKTIHTGNTIALFGPPPANGPKKGDLVDTQASYAIPLALGAFNEENAAYAIEHLENAVTRKNRDDGGVERPEFSLMTGFIGTASIGDALSQNGKAAIAYRLFQTETYPSWLYPVKNGATTIWERLNSYTHEEGFGGNNSMNSFNHYAFGAVVSWMYNYILGIQRDMESPGFKHFILAPIPDPTKQMTYAKGYYDSMYGRIESQWEHGKEGIKYRFIIPANSSATVQLEGENEKIVTINGKLVENQQKVYNERIVSGKMNFDLPSGSYEIYVKK